MGTLLSNADSQMKVEEAKVSYWSEYKAGKKSNVTCILQHCCYETSLICNETVSDVPIIFVVLCVGIRVQEVM